MISYPSRAQEHHSIPHSKFSWQQKMHEVKWIGRWPTQNHPMSFHGGGGGCTWLSLIPVWHLLTTKTSNWFCRYHDSLSECSKLKFYVVKWVSLSAKKKYAATLGKIPSSMASHQLSMSYLSLTNSWNEFASLDSITLQWPVGKNGDC